MHKRSLLGISSFERYLELRGTNEPADERTQSDQGHFAREQVCKLWLLADDEWRVNFERAMKMAAR